jgi:tRNA (guanine-N7-)-methyltransferase
VKHLRQRHIKQATLEHLTSMGVYHEPMLLELKKEKVHLEIGSGKGQFIAKLAKDHPNELFIAVEMDRNVCYRIAEKKMEDHLENLIILLTEANHLDLWLKAGSIDIIYLNFSDPWPKARHHKRRLTWPLMLEKYKYLLKKEGILQFRTDHLGLFEDSITYLDGYFNVFDMTLDLKPSLYMTEYEEKKRKLGHIYQLKGTIIHD